MLGHVHDSKGGREEGAEIRQWLRGSNGTERVIGAKMFEDRCGRLLEEEERARSRIAERFLVLVKCGWAATRLRVCYSRQGQADSQPWRMLLQNYVRTTLDVSSKTKLIRDEKKQLSISGREGRRKREGKRERGSGREGTRSRKWSMNDR
ncbi:hypothetical protein M406DRAFT_354489 [Cryphonectria parasitica EP155]|uniref:Uncharacterized protein n=1 Tax=Cryphonectria parasitica (strain ATCC 38755 / EP155) TaxID=660469 RepID=A0A9P4YCU0_CRYP1|nr:uncharacterized protein M406DRAFT_354489 [Cryphonectria parasitica EP155]KAF3770532.1 hypothetical protein M406DRAFT_354489 [Cryphonectria parasitica EP155]